VVAALTDGEISEKTFTPERFRDPQVLDLLQRVTLEEDPHYTREFPKTFHCTIEVTGRSGQKWVRHRKNPKGHPANPMSDTEIEEKFLRLTAEMLTQKQAQNALSLLWRLEEIGDVCEVIKALTI
jgi:2-methylcitrate dehydratase